MRVEMAKTEKNHNQLQQLANQRKDIVNIHKDVLLYLDKTWIENDWLNLCLFEYEQYYEVAFIDREITDKNQYFSLILENYRKFAISETKEMAIELMQLYSDMRCYGKAAMFRQMQLPETLAQVIHIEEVKQTANEEVASNVSKSQYSKLKFSSEQIQEYLNLFAGREDLYAIETLNFQGKRCYQMVKEPLREEEIRRHLEGKQTIGTYIQRLNSTVKYMVMDIDISRSILLRYQYQEEMIEEYKEIARRQVREIVKIYKRLGLSIYVEDSGYRGYHLWLFFEEWIPVRYAHMFQRVIEGLIEKVEEGITIEYFPNKVRVKEDKAGQIIKLPEGIHIKSGKRSYFVDEDFVKIDIKTLLDSHSRVSLQTIKKIIAKYAKDEQVVSEGKNVDLDLSLFGKLDVNVETVLKKCTLMKYLCNKAVKTGYLMHGERLSILYVFGHLGTRGKEFVHQVLSFTLNYQFDTTEKFIRKLPEKPISCTKLREQYRQVTAEFGCSCAFYRIKNCYPSPVLHAIKDGKM
ncbi:putative helicase [Lachnospiraceae bacterium TWA4]|nr:putative helicase [Lachnospiraceae bacterium TWA4]